MKFANRQHEEGVRALAEGLGVNFTEMGARYQGGVYLLGLLGPSMAGYARHEDGYIDLGALKTAAGPWSSGERAIVELASHLIDPQGHQLADLADTLGDLSSTWAEPAVAAIWLASKAEWPTWWQD